MPFQKQVEDEVILDQFHIRESDLDRKAFTPDELAKNLEITGEAVRQRLYKMEEDRVERLELGGTTLWKKKGDVVFAAPRMTPRTLAWGLITVGGIVLIIGAFLNSSYFAASEITAAAYLIAFIGWLLFSYSEAAASGWFNGPSISRVIASLRRSWGTSK